MSFVKNGYSNFNVVYYSICFPERMMFYMKKMNDKNKKTIIRVVMLIAAIAVLLTFVVLPIMISTSAEELGKSLVVSEFEKGSLQAALTEAADGTDRNEITNISVSGGILNAADYSAICELPNLEHIELAGAQTENGIIPDNALPARNQLTYISLPLNTQTIGNGAFTNNKKLIKISMPDSVRSVGDYAFDGCISLTDIVIPAGADSIGEAAFRDCQSLTKFTLPAGVTEIPAYCFTKCAFTEFYVGPQVTFVGEGAFSDCNELKDIYFYGDTAPELGGSSVFQNLKVVVHTPDDADSYESWENNFVDTEDDFNEEYIPPETAAPAETAISAETSAEAEKTEISENQTAKNNDKDDKYDDKMNESDHTDSEKKSGGVSSGVVVILVIVIAVLVAALSVVITILVMKRK